MDVLVFLPNRGTMSRLVITMPARVPLLFVIKVVFFCSSIAYIVQATMEPNSIKKAFNIILCVNTSYMGKVLTIKMSTLRDTSRTTRIYLDGRVLRPIIKPRPSFGYFSTVI